MNKNEILEQSRKENKNKDLYEKEVLKSGANAGAIAATILATVFFCVQIFLGEGINYGLYAVAFIIPTAEFFVKSFKLKRKHEIAVCILYSVIVVLFSIAHIYQLVTMANV